MLQILQLNNFMSCKFHRSSLIDKHNTTWHNILQTIDTTLKEVSYLGTNIYLYQKIL